jgi:hypothetical protein
VSNALQHLAKERRPGVPQEFAPSDLRPPRCLRPLGRSSPVITISLAKTLTDRLLAQIELRPGMLKPIAWACEQPLNQGGPISLEIRPMNDHAWRKSI